MKKEGEEEEEEVMVKMRIKMNFLIQVLTLLCQIRKNSLSYRKSKDRNSEKKSKK